jgi:hypothetical protein
MVAKRFYHMSRSQNQHFTMYLKEKVNFCVVGEATGPPQFPSTIAEGIS